MARASVEPLTSAALVCRASGLDGVEHAVQRISGFLDYARPEFWTLPRACARGRSTSLLTRLAARETLNMDAFHRASECSKALEHAARRGDVAAIEWLCTTYCPTVFVSLAMEEAARAGHVAVLTWFAQHRSAYILWTTDVMDAAAASGHVPALEWLTQHPQTPGCSRNAMDLAARNGHIDTVEWLYDRGHRGTKRAVEDAIVYGHIPVVSFLLAHDHPSRICPAMDYAARHNQLAMLAWLDARVVAECTSDAMDFAAQSGHLQVVEWLHTHRTEGCTVYAMDSAAENGHLEVVQWLHAHRTEGCTRAAMDYAAKQGHLAVVQWLHANRTEGCTSSAMDGAAASGHLDVVQWLHRHRTEGCTSRAIDSAAGHGHLALAQWLQDERGVEFTASAMDTAASNGHLHVVQWLHDHTSAGCTVGAMDSAAAHNHLDVVQWLHTHRTEGCSVRVMDWAVAGDHIAMVEWLAAYRSEGSSSDVFHDARSAPMMRLLHALYPTRLFSPQCVRSAVVHGDFTRLQFLHEHCPVALRDALQLAWPVRIDVEVFQWLYAHYGALLHVASVRTNARASHYLLALLDRMQLGRSDAVESG